MHDSNEHSQPSRRRFGGAAGGLLIGLIVGLVIGLIQGDLLEGAGFGLIVGLAIGVGLEGRGTPMQYQPGAMRRILLAGGLFLITLLLTLEFIDQLPAGGAKTLFALIPAAGFLLFVLALGAAIGGLDELQRRIQTEAISIGFGLAAVVMLAVGLLDQVGVEQPNWIYAGVPMIVGWGLGKLWTMWKYR
jgi:hypothetical protein